MNINLNFQKDGKNVASLVVEGNKVQMVTTDLSLDDALHSLSEMQHILGSFNQTLKHSEVVKGVTQDFVAQTVFTDGAALDINKADSDVDVLVDDRTEKQQVHIEHFMKFLSLPGLKPISSHYEIVPNHDDPCMYYLKFSDDDMMVASSTIELQVIDPSKNRHFASSLNANYGRLGKDNDGNHYYIRRQTQRAYDFYEDFKAAEHKYKHTLHEGAIR